MIQKHVVVRQVLVASLRVCVEGVLRVPDSSGNVRGVLSKIEIELQAGSEGGAASVIVVFVVVEVDPSFLGVVVDEARVVLVAERGVGGESEVCAFAALFFGEVSYLNYWF